MIDGVSYVTATRGRDRRRGAPVHQPDAGAGQGEGRQDRQEDVRRDGLQRQRHRRAGHDRGDAAERAGLQRGGRSPTPTSTRTRSRPSTRPRALETPGQGHRRDALALGRAHRRPRAPGPATASACSSPRRSTAPSRCPQEVVQEQQTLEKDQKVDWATWQALDAETPLRLEAPTAWSPGFTYDQFRNYSHRDDRGQALRRRRSPSSQTPQYGYWSIQAMRWLDPPAIQNPNTTQKIGGRTYMLFYQGDHLHMVAWKERGHAVLGAQHPRQPALQRPHDGPRDVLQAREVNWLRAVAAAARPVGRPSARRPARHGRRHPAGHARPVAAGRRHRSRRCRLEAPAPGRRGRVRHGRPRRLLHRRRLAAPRRGAARRSRPSSWRRASPGSRPPTATRRSRRIAGSAGPGAAAAALGGALGVSMDAWIALDRKAHATSRSRPCSR